MGQDSCQQKNLALAEFEQSRPEAKE